MKTKMTLIMALAIAALAVAASSALAASPEWLINGGAMTANEGLKETKTEKDSALLGKIVGTATEILCNAITVKSGELIKEKTATAILRFEKECVVNKPTGTGCKVPNIETVALLGTLTSLTTIKFTPKAGTTFATVVIEGCSGLFSFLNGKHPVVADEGGGQTCTIVNAGTEAVTHEVSCAESGSENLLFEGEKAEFEGAANVTTVTNKVSVS